MARRFLSAEEVRIRQREARGRESEPKAPDGPYELRKSGTWWKVIGPDGHQVGTAVRSEEEARAALEALR